MQLGRESISHLAGIRGQIHIQEVQPLYQLLLHPLITAILAIYHACALILAAGDCPEN
jgi:hypothetical protein